MRCSEMFLNTIYTKIGGDGGGGGLAILTESLRKRKKRERLAF